jgi:hypothetical protein
MADARCGRLVVVLVWAFDRMVPSGKLHAKIEEAGLETLEYNRQLPLNVGDNLTCVLDPGATSACSWIHFTICSGFILVSIAPVFCPPLPPW